MFQVLILTCVIGSSWTQEFYPNKLNVPANTAVPYYHKPAIVHKVQLGSELQGDYKFTYDTGKGPLGQSYRTETRLPDGSVKGSYGYLDQNNQPRIVRYLAGKEGFVAEGDVGPVDSPPPAPKPIPHHLVANKPRQYLPPQQRVASQPPRYLPPQQRVASQPPRYLPPQQRVASQPPRYLPPQQRVASQPPRYLPPQQSVASQPPRHAPQQQVVRPVLQRDFVPEPQFHLESPEDLGPPFIDTSFLSYNIGTKQRT